MAENPTRYWAFISYSHHDVRVARWLTQALARQRVPRSFRKLVTSGEDRFESVFLDESHVGASAQLGDALEDALRQSRSLIVIASPFAVASPHVEREIAYFQSLGRNERVLCLVASGIPNSTDQGEPAVESFPRGLRFRIRDGALSDEPLGLHERPLAARLGEETEPERRHATEQIVAGLLGVSLDRLRAMRSRRAWILSGLSIAAALAMGAVSWKVWDQYFRVQESYYRDYVRRLGVWEGVDPLTRDELERGGGGYVFERRGRAAHPERVRLVNGYGECPAGGMSSILEESLATECAARKACEAVFEYNKQDGSVNSEQLRSQFGTEMETIQYVGESAGTFFENNYACSHGRTGIKFLTFSRIESGLQQGLDRRIEFQRGERTHVPHPNSHHVFGYEIEYDDKGRRRILRPLGEAGVMESWMREVVYERDERGHVVNERYADPAGKPASWLGWSNPPDVDPGDSWVTVSDFVAAMPVAAQQGWKVSPAVSRHHDRDSWGARVRSVYFDAEGNPVPNFRGAKEVRFVRNGRGVVEVSYWNGSNERVATVQGYSLVRYQLDARGRITGERFFDRRDQPAVDASGCAAYVAEWASNGSLNRGACLDENGQLRRSKQGWARVESKWTPSGDLAERAYFDCDGHSTLNYAGIARMVNRFDQWGRRESVVNFAADAKATVDNRGVAIGLNAFDDLGNLTRHNYLGLDGLPVISKDGYAGWMSEYDDRGNETDTIWLGVDGKPLLQATGYAMTKSRFDSRGAVTEIAYFGVNAEAVLKRDGVAGFTAKYDDRGNQIKIAYFGLNHEPVLNMTGFAGSTSTYNVRGMETKKAYFGVNGEAVLSSSGCAELTLEYDDRGNLIEGACIGVNGEPILHKSGYARFEAKYDDHGNQIGRACFGVNGEACLLKDGSSGFTAKYDDRGSRIEEAYFGVNRESVLNNGGVAGFTAKFDDRGNRIEEAYFGVHRESVLNNDGVAGFTAKYDDRGNRVELAYFGISHEPIADSKSGCVGERTRYELPNREIERACIGVGGGAASHLQSGRAIVTTEYDRYGRKIKESSLDSDRHLVNRIDEGWSYKTWSYDQPGSVAREQRFDKDGHELVSAQTTSGKP